MINENRISYVIRILGVCLKNTWRIVGRLFSLLADNGLSEKMPTRLVLCVNRCKNINNYRSFKICERGVNEYLLLLSCAKIKRFELEKSGKYVAKPMVSHTESTYFL